MLAMPAVVPVPLSDRVYWVPPTVMLLEARKKLPLLRLPPTFADLVVALEKGGKAHIAQQLHDFVGLVSYAAPDLVIRPAKPLPAEFLRDLGAALKALTGTAWQVRASDEPAALSLLDQEKAAAERLRQEVLDAPLVKAAFEAFPEAELAGFRLDEPRSA